MAHVDGTLLQRMRVRVRDQLRSRTATVLAKGYDFSSARPGPAVVLAAGGEFVLRYGAPSNSSTSWKLLTKAEADAYRAAGVQVVANFEWYAGRCLEGKSAGVADANTAKAFFKSCGWQPGRPIVFSADVDTTGAKVLPYYQGVASVLGVQDTGAYGSYQVVKYLINAGVLGVSLDSGTDGVTRYWGWQTYAWSGGAYEERCVLSQDKNGIKIGGSFEVDLDHAHAPDYGQWDYVGDDDLATSQSDFDDMMNKWATSGVTADAKKALAKALFQSDAVPPPDWALAANPTNTTWTKLSYDRNVSQLLNDGTLVQQVADAVVAKLPSSVTGALTAEDAAKVAKAVADELSARIAG